MLTMTVWKKRNTKGISGTYQQPDFPLNMGHPVDSVNPVYPSPYSKVNHAFGKNMLL